MQLLSVISCAALAAVLLGAPSTHAAAHKRHMTVAFADSLDDGLRLGEHVPQTHAPRVLSTNRRVAAANLAHGSVSGSLSGRAQAVLERETGVIVQLCTALMKYMRPVPTSEVHRLARNAAAVNEAARRGSSLARVVALRGDCRTLQVLRDSGADLQTPSPTTRATAMHAAAFHGHLECAALLLEAGVDASPRTADDATPLDVAIVRGDHGMASLILSYGGTRGPEFRLRQGWPNIMNTEYYI